MIFFMENEWIWVYKGGSGKLMNIGMNVDEWEFN